LSDFFNIVIPATKVDDLLVNCVYHTLKQTHKNYRIVIVIDDDYNIKRLFSLPNKNHIKIDLIKTSDVNISTKRNLGANKSKSDFLAFIDSDAYPVKNWLKNSLNIFNEKKIEVVTGPSGLPFPNKSYLNNLINLSKRSYFSSGLWTKRKYSTEDFFIDQAETSNFIIKTESFKKVGGMNEKIYIGEDTNFCKKINDFFGENKMFYSGKSIIFHKDRSLKNFILQRLAWGMYIDVEFNNLHGLNKLLIFLPLIGLIIGTIFLILCFKFINFIFILIILFIFFCYILFRDLSKFQINFIQKSICVFIIIVSNISYSIGNLICLTRFQKYIGKKIYRNSRT